MASKPGRRYPLVMYTRMMHRWWTAIFTLGLGMIGLAYGLRVQGLVEWRWYTMGFLGIVYMLAGAMVWLLGKAAYVQPYSDHLKLATPFFRLNISYKRIRRTLTANMGSLFPPKSISRTQVEIIEPLARMTALVIELNAMPMPQSTLRFFLSPLFFKDKTPHIVILVEDWMRFSAELESMRTGGVESISSQQRRDISILSKLPPKR